MDKANQAKIKTYMQKEVLASEGSNPCTYYHDRIHPALTTDSDMSPSQNCALCPTLNS